MIQAKTSELSSKVLEGKPIRLSFHYHTRDIARFINSLLMKLLANNDMTYLQSVVETILREMIVNAVKANSKRVYFKKHDMNIEDKEQYTNGMQNFKSFIIQEQKALIRDLKSGGYRVDLIVRKNEKGYDVLVRNNTSLLQFEKERIQYRIDKAKSYSDFSDIYMDISDDLEGEGLGIPLTILFLRNSGIGENSFSIRSRGDTTQSAFTIPFHLQPLEITERIQKEIIDKVEDLPTFPEYIRELQALCLRKDVSISEVAQKVSLDPSLAASVLRLANSGGFITARTIENLQDAIMIIGLKNLNAILVTVSARKIMDEHFSEFREVWKHCNKTAFYARKIAEAQGLNALSDRVYLASLLHDLGKIVLFSINPAMMEWLSSFPVERKVRTSTVIEEVSIGISHATIGRLIAEKWKFPEYLIESISKHHSPLNASPANRDIVFITSMANKLCLIEDKKFDFYFFEDKVLEQFELTGEKTFNAFHQKLKDMYENQ